VAAGGEYRKTLNLPRTAFPMKAELVKREPQVLAKWDSLRLYEKLRELRKGAPPWMLHDGPPYANGDAHIGHLLNRTLKDAVVRYKFMRGFDAAFVPGWDCHGQPIEINYLKETGRSAREAQPLELRKACADYARRWIAVQKERFRRLGAIGDWEHPYTTMDADLEAREIECVGRLILDGFITRGKKPVLWCASCETALAENAVEYGPHESHSVYVKFRVKEWSPAAQPALKKAVPLKPISVVIWTTTPWTLPANVAIAFHPRFIYDLVDVGHELLLMAHDLVPAVLAAAGLRQHGDAVASLPGSALEGIKCDHPFVKRQSVGILADYVTLDTGTGCVHIAPGHGAEDYMSGVQYRLPVLAPVDGAGKFTDEYPEMKGKFVFDANPDIVNMMKKSGALLAEGKLEHSYPFCWRCKKPVIFRATEQWFISLEHQDLRRRSVESIKKVKWYPNWGGERLSGMIGLRPDWCISRQRSWGVPIPVFYCEACGAVLATRESLGAVRERVEREGTDCWWVREAAELLPAGTRCPKCGGKKFRKEMDTLDVWFDSGVTHASVLRNRPGLSWPADLYLEGSDQHRGWFNASLLTGMALDGRPPYRAVVTHGIFLDLVGEKMSKSKGNILTADEAFGKWGADLIRLWTLSENYHEDMRFSEEILNRVTDAYRKLRNTLRFLLGNIDGLDADPAPPEAAFTEVDRWMRWRTSVLVREVTGAMEEYAFYRAVQAIHRFCAVELSAFYLDLLKDRMYVSRPADPARLASRRVMAEMLSVLARLLAPLIPFTAEEVWDCMPESLRGGLPSVQMADWPKAPERAREAEESRQWDMFMRLRDAVLKALETARQAGTVAMPLESRVVVEAAGEWEKFARSLGDGLAEMLIVSQAVVSTLGAGAAPDVGSDEGKFKITVTPPEGTKCGRCWLVRPSVGRDKEHPALCERCADVVRRLK